MKIQLFFAKFSLKHPFIIKTLSVIFSILAIIGLLILSFIAFFVICFNIAAKEYTDVKDYNKAKNSICEKDFIKHFPKEIPNNAKDIQLYKSANPFFGSEKILLVFKIDKKYINDEINKIKPIKNIGPYSNIKEYKDNYVKGIIFNSYSFDQTNFKFYIIGDNSINKSNFHLEYGIAVNDKTNQILYYYAVLD